MTSPRLSTSGQFDSARESNGPLSPLSSPKQALRPQGRLPSFTSSRAPSGAFSAMRSVSKPTRGSGTNKIRFVQESASSLKKKSLAELGVGAYQAISDVSYVKFLEWIRSERLTTLPHKGSRWDKVLIRGLYFAEQLHNFEQVIQNFAVDSSVAAAIGYGHAQLLLDLGHHNSEALDKAFSVFYKFATSFSFVLHRSELLAATPEIQEQLCLLYTDLLSLVTDVAIKFYKTVNGMTSDVISFDIFELFGTSIETFNTRQSSVVELIWSFQIEKAELEDGEALDVKVLSNWLEPKDRVLASLNRDHSTFVEQQADFTCLWFQKKLSNFIQSDDNFLLVTGQSGAGKTTLAGSIIERLQRPVNRKQFDTVFCSVSPNIPTTATSLAVVKSLLSQLLNMRVGNMGMYYALFRAYNECRVAGDAKAFEDHLWQALIETLQEPAKNSNELVIVVDGLDEITESQSTSVQANGTANPTALLERLVSVTNQGLGVRLITLSSSIKTPSLKGSYHEITRDDVRDDIHAIAIRAFTRNQHFTSQRAYDQETFLNRIIQAANGSFLWASLACENLNTQKSPEAFTKSLENLETSKPSVHDLVLKVFTALNTTSHAKTLLSWLLAAERPLTIDEIHTLFTVDIRSGTLSDTGINVNEILDTLKPLLILHERIVRFRHPLVHSALAHHGQVSKESQTDLLLRVLTYAKVTLRDENEPRWIESSDTTVADRLFHKHPFLEYTARYWVLHLQRSPLAPKPNEVYKATAELQKVLPSTTLLPVLEQLSWNIEPPTRTVELHKLAGTVRRAVFTVNHPSVLQTYLAIVTNYLLRSNTKEAQSYLYYCITIARKVLSDIHPLTLECANQFLMITETLTTTSRTEIMTRREETLIILITAYERQYGSTSELVTQTRKLLAELYTSINEEDRALEIYRLIQESVVQQYGRGSVQSREMQSQLGVTLGKGQNGRDIDSYQHHLFEEEDEDDDELQIFTLASIGLYLRRAESHMSRKEFALAEKTFVELWMEVSSTCRTVQSIEWHEKHIEVATIYSQFLKSQSRTTESAAILTCIWQQYSQHQVSFAESIVSRLSKVAKEMKSIGCYSQALSVFKFANSYNKRVRKEESQFSREIDNEISETSTELVKQSLSGSSSVTETTSTVSESVFQDVFFSIIQSSKAVDSSTIALAKKLTAQYVEKKSYTEAINVIHATLKRTWSSFLSSSIQDVVMTTTFTQESIELVEILAEIYVQTRQLDKVEDTYSRFFRATLVSQNVDKVTFEKARTLLIGFYDKHDYADKAIGIFQEILVTYRARLGHTHELTIQTLYTLARRCQSHPRNHPYWIDYYLQIITSLNKDSDVCHKDALDAIIIVTNTYSEDRRYAEAVTIYRVLWNTYVRNTKEHKIFSDAKFVSTLYERYYRCLEETKASYETLYQITDEYHKTTVATFGAESTIAVEAMLQLASVSQRSEKHLSQAISLYESISKSSKTSTTKMSVTDINQALSSLYVRQMHSASSSTVKAESVQRALSMTEERFAENASKFGYSHESSLTQLRELVVLYHRQQKTDLAVKQLTTAVCEIITKEKSSQKMIESAASIAASFHACEQTSTAHSLVEELHRQICAKETKYTEKWSFVLTKTDRSTLAFLASLQYNLREDLTVTFAEIMADLTMEYIYFEQFRHVLQNNGSMKNILVAAAPLRWFLRRNGQDKMISVVEDQAVGLFVKSDAKDLNTLSKESPRIFLIGILEHMGNGRNKDFNRSVILASNNSVAKLTKAKRFPEAYDVANLGFLFASGHDGYNGPRAIGLGFKLASLLVGLNGEKSADPALRKKTLELSNRIVKKILDICKKSEVNFAQIQLSELSNLSALLGEQQDYETLEWLLKTLWNTRDAQRSWPAEVLLNLGRRLICARYLAGLPVKAIRLAEDIAYNMRRAHGPRAPITIETYELLAQLYTSTGQSYQAKTASDPSAQSLARDYFKKALGVHEDILRVVVREKDDDSDEEDEATAYLLAKEGVSVSTSNGQHVKALDADSIDRSAIALRHLHLLKLAYQRLGAWPKSNDEYIRLNAQVFGAFGSESSWKGVQGVERWDAKQFGSGKAESQEGVFAGVKDWGFGSDRLILHAQEYPQNGV
ncbi:hypothetical protein P153DRAFT_314293 [Dothidotthia symphoricarpi CBS 119687]|uniref:NACHT domain-containing protein n=1 Tax=Dothidotthia symphoricarpi CBS 119687 TaxID=1392245 RepID=A0A6A6AEU7_9PLEO|nr:uncharacterized protein P153DRAFT_314293 [Dothidotthia symphoricarpi CBS 119687]KAF2130419.1 hypothetical protein P153DRAFT_314293 [Dothidotthia symphoricarpi CBS 119687]